MKAKIVSITPNVIEFDILNDDGTPYRNAENNPVTLTVPGWIDRVPADFTEEDVQALVDREMAAYLSRDAAMRAVLAERQAKIDKLATIRGSVEGLEFKMDEPPSVSITTPGGIYEAPVEIDADVKNARTISYRVIDRASGGEVEGSEGVSLPITLTLAPGDYTVEVVVSNRRGSAADSVDITIKGQTTSTSKG